MTEVQNQKLDKNKECCSRINDEGDKECMLDLENEIWL